MMKKLIVLLSIASLFFLFCSYIIDENTNKYKCLIQMKNYSGEGAYIVISVINPEGNYDETIYVQGDDPEWYYEITSWWKFYGKKRSNIDAISGETLAGGERSMKVISIDKTKFNAGYKLRFESAVESDDYFEKDIEFDVVESNFETKHNGKGFIRYIRFIEL